MKIDLEHDTRLIRFTISGDIDERRFLELASEGNRLANKHVYNVLWDVRDTVLKIDIGTLYFLLNEIPEKQEPIARRIRAAAIVSQQEKQKWDFIELRGVNSGYQRKVFINEVEAEKWLCE